MLKCDLFWFALVLESSLEYGEQIYKLCQMANGSLNAAAANLAVIRALHLEITIKCFNYILLPRESVVRIIYGNVN